MPKFSLESLKISAEYRLTSQDYFASLDLDWRSFRETSQSALNGFLNLATTKLLLDLQPAQFFTNLHTARKIGAALLLPANNTFNVKCRYFTMRHAGAQRLGRKFQGKDEIARGDLKKDFTSPVKREQEFAK